MSEVKHYGILGQKWGVRRYKSRLLPEWMQILPCKIACPVFNISVLYGCKVLTYKGVNHLEDTQIIDLFFSCSEGTMDVRPVDTNVVLGRTFFDKSGFTNPS